MPSRATKRGAERTPLEGSWDVLVCGACFAGLAVARELRGHAARACSSSTATRSASGRRRPARRRRSGSSTSASRARSARRSATSSSTPREPTSAGGCRGRSRPSTTASCARCWTPRTTPPSRRRRSTARTGHTVHTDRGDLTAPLVVDALGWRRVLRTPPSRSSRPRPGSRAAWRSTPRASAHDLELWLDPKYVRAGYGWAFPAGDELRVGVGSFDPRDHVKEPTVALAGDLSVAAERYQGNWIPHQMRDGGRGRRLLRGRLRGPLPAHDGRGHPHRALLRPGLRARAARGRRGPPVARARAGPLRGLLRGAPQRVRLAPARPVARVPRQPDAPDGADRPGDGPPALPALVLRPLPRHRAPLVRARRRPGRSARRARGARAGVVALSRARRARRPPPAGRSRPAWPR